MPDPFDRVLQKLGLYQRIQGMEPVPTAAMPAPQNNTVEVPCGIQAKDHTGDILAISEIPIEVREEQALQFIKFIHHTGETTKIRPMSLILNLNGMVEAEPIHMDPGNQPGVYPARYSIPPSTIRDLQLQEQVWRAEKFALGTLLYELLAGHRIFEGEHDDAVQRHYSTATFPDLEELPVFFQYFIYACWSAEFGHYIALGTFGRYVHNHPIRFALQVTSGFVSIATLIAVPVVLAAVGFSALGPVAGSAAAGWQASIGAVEAGSLFALCQSAAMGGAAATGLAVTGVASGAATIAALGLPSLASLRGTFVREFRR